MDKALETPGRPLDAVERRFFEPRFGQESGRAGTGGAPARAPQARLRIGAAGDAHEREADRVAERVTGAKAPAAPSPRHDFSQVRVHTDPQAAESASALNAQAFTVGDHIVFGSGRYDSESHEGRKLLAHELTHVVQQRNAPPSQEGVVRRKGDTPWGFFSNIVQAIFSPGFADTTLQDYVTFLLTDRSIENDFDSDNKAMAVVELWRAGKNKRVIMIGDRTFTLTPLLRNLLAEELTTGDVWADEKKAAAELRAFSLEEAPKEKEPGAADKAKAEEGPTPAEKGAAKIREKLKGQAETRKVKGKNIRIGGIRLNAGAQADVRKFILIDKDDTAHLEIVDGRLGYDADHKTPLDPFRWNAIVQMVEEGQVEIFAVSPSADIKCEQVFKNGKVEPFDGALSLLGGNGVTIVRKEISDLLGKPGPTEGPRLISTTGRDQVYYKTGHSAMAHELFGHVWLAMHGVPYGHGQELKGTQSIRDPFGEKYTGSVDDYVGKFVQRPDRQPESLTLGVTEAGLDEALGWFVATAGDPKAFTITRSMTGASKELVADWLRLKAPYTILLANPGNEAARLKRVVAAIRKVYNGYDKDHKEAFDRFMFARADISSSKPNPEAHVVRQLGIQNPNITP